MVCGTHDGYFQDPRPVIRAIQDAHADVVFVCLGAPKQELWMAEYGPSTGARLMVGLGGALDVFAGAVERAPGEVAEDGHGVALPAAQGAPAHRPHGQAAPGAGGRRWRPAARKVRARQMSGRLIVFEGTDGSGKSTSSPSCVSGWRRAARRSGGLSSPSIRSPRPPCCGCI